MNIVKEKLSVSNCLKCYNAMFRRNYVVSDVASYVGCSREVLQRLSTFSSYALVSCVIDAIQFLYFKDFSLHYASLEDVEVRDCVYGFLLVK